MATGLTGTVGTAYFMDLCENAYFTFTALRNTSLSTILPTDFHLFYLTPPTIHIRMCSHDEIISPPATHRTATYLRPFVNQNAGPELREILGHTRKFIMTRQLRQDLLAEVSPDTNECTQAIDMWITRLNLIKSGLASFPMLIDGGGTSTTTQSLTIAPPKDGTTQAQRASPIQASIAACLKRDQYQCIIIGRISNGSGKEVVPIILFAFANHTNCRDLDFWKMLEMFYGSEATDKLFAGILERVNSLENLITLDSSIRAMFNSGSLTLTPESKARSDPCYK